MKRTAMPPQFLTFACIALTTLGISAVQAAELAGSVPETTPNKQTVREFRKSYEVGVTRTAAVGEPIVAVKDYFVTTEDVGAVVIPTESFEVWAIGPTVTRIMVGAAGTPIPVAADTTADGKRFHIIETAVAVGKPGYIAIGLYIDDDGKMRLDRRRQHFVSASDSTKKKSDASAEVPRGVRLTPPQTLFPYSQNKREIVEAKGYVNYEIIFTGRSSDQLTFMYREFSKDDLARQAFFQQLTYSASEPIFRFRNLRVRVDRISNEGLTYTVLED
jgi:hypothetical protein